VHHESRREVSLGIAKFGHLRAARAIVRAAASAVVGGTFLLAGCGYTGDAEIEPETSAAATPPAATAPAPPDDGTRPPARSAYGKAMEAAHRLEDKVEDYNKKIEQAADDAFK
jgi:outer membrane murein-binding lipoprotein Lpp